MGDCRAHDKPEGYYTPIPHGDDHCLDCHCNCADPTYALGSCGHWIGCPGC